MVEWCVIQLCVVGFSSMANTVVMSSKSFNRTVIVVACRLVAAVWIVSACVYRQELDDFVQEVWLAMRANEVFQYESFEPFLSVASFMVFIGMWGMLDFFVPSASKYRSNPSEDMSSWMGGTRYRDQFFWYLVPLVTLDLLFPRRYLPEKAPSALRLAAEVIGAIMVYDISFFAWHSTIHLSPYLFKRIHAKHHAKLVQRAPESVRHTFVDGSMDVMCSIFALNVLRCHPMSRALYDVVIIALITELHAGYDLPWQLHNVVPFGLYGGAPRHERHHREGHVYMQKFGTYLDEAFGFVPCRESSKEIQHE